MEEEEACPVCKSDRYLNPKMYFFVSPCFHKICDGCVGRLFASGSGPCPICKTSLRRGHWVVPSFEDIQVERECRVRRRLAGIFCKQEADFESLKDYNDYLEEVEDIVFSLVNDVDVQLVEAKIEAYRLANQDLIKRSLQKQSTEAQRFKTDLAEEEVRRRAIQAEALKDLQSQALAAKQDQVSFIKALESSNESAVSIQSKYKQLKTSALRTVDVTDLPSLRGLKTAQKGRKAKMEEIIDPLETVPLLALPSTLLPPDNLVDAIQLTDAIDTEKALAGGYTKEWLLSACWQSAFSYGLLV